MVMPAQWKRGPRPDPGVIELLESLCESARKGHIRVISVVTVNPLLEVDTATAGELDNVKKHLVIGGLSTALIKIQEPRSE